MWDKIKDLDSLSKQGMTNLAQFLIHLIIGKGLPLSVLKVNVIKGHTQFEFDRLTSTKNS